jgi:hypothetical protein
MSKYGPTRGEWRFRLIVSLCGLALMAGALVFRGIPTGPAFVEVVLIAGAFFGGSAVLSAVKLRKSDRD